MRGVGHFVAVLSIKDGQVTLADSLSGEAVLPLEVFRKRYHFSGFHLSIFPK